MSLFISLLKEGNFTDAKSLLLRKETVVNDVDDESGNHCIFYSLQCYDVLLMILKLKPEATKLTTRIGNNPLHVAVQSNASIDIINLLLTTNRKSCALINIDGKLPIHYACAGGSRTTLQLIDTLISSHPTGAAVKEHKNNSCSLHFAIAFKCNSDVVKCILMSYPAITMETDSNGYLPLHLAIIYDANVDVITQLIDISPESVQVYDSKKRLPLHLAVQFGSCSSIISHLVKAYPASLGVKDGTERIAMHLAFKYKISLDSIDILLRNDDTITCMGKDKEKLKLFKEGLNRDSDSSSSSSSSSSGSDTMNTNYAIIHSAIEYGCNEDVINLIISIAPLAASQLSDDGKLPIHFASWHQSSLGIIKALIRAYPDGVRIKEYKYHNLPIHYAAQYQADVRAASFILSSYPDGAMITNISGKLPIHLAARYKADALFVNALIKYHPFSIGIVDSTGRLPLDYALEYDAKADVIKLLFGINKTKKRDIAASTATITSSNSDSKDDSKDDSKESQDSKWISIDIDADHGNSNEEEYEKLTKIIMAAPKINDNTLADEFKLLAVGKGSIYTDNTTTLTSNGNVDHHIGDVKFGLPPFDHNDVFGEEVPVATVAIGVGIRRNISDYLIKIKQQNDEIASLALLVNKQRIDINDKGSKIDTLSKDLQWCNDKIKRLEDAMPKNTFVSNKFQEQKADSNKSYIE